MFRFSATTHQRRHGPSGYIDYPAYKDWLRDDFEYRCVYCLVRESWSQAGADVFGADHAIPKKYRPDLRSEYSNLFYACNRCNSFKGEERVMDPDKHALATHLRIENDGLVTPLTKAGERQCMVLELNEAEAVRYRKKMIDTISFIRENLPKTQSLLNKWLGYPEELPNLGRKLPPRGNSIRAGIQQSAYVRRQESTLPATY